ncbi:hypothetical protein A0H81_05598 [Grifola frondosa]|uniref:Reverse transcriptase domain-containing protein n=1 Tax=Grifola frondosa TaxID=5627 RepID=A0A1C7MD33_GRIFR|nr:hypothetical protein A0H81_05598 [Grifola frondosa]
MGEIPLDYIDTEDPNNIFTRQTDPFNAKHVEAILKAVLIGTDLSDEQCKEVRNTIQEYADCFALSVSEVTLVPGTIHKLNVTEGATFSRKKIHKLLAAGVIEACNPSQVKCIAPITLAKKVHEGEGLALEELQHQVNDQCILAGYEPIFNLPPRPESTDIPTPTAGKQKWRICQNFGDINRITEIAPMPQGDIRAKQQSMSGHRWISIFDFTSGFYVVTIPEESRPYTCFYVEGRGYFWCIRMPFGLTGAPSTFAQLTVMHLHDLLADNMLTLFVNDGAAAGDTFEEMMDKLHKILNRVRESKLSLSPSKTRRFMTEAIFAGANVGPKGVMPDLAKLTTVVNWEQPDNALNVVSFLGLTSHFQDLIRGYSWIEGPLHDLIKAVNAPAGCSKTMLSCISSDRY